MKPIFPFLRWDGLILLISVIVWIFQRRRARQRRPSRPPGSRGPGFQILLLDYAPIDRSWTIRMRVSVWSVHQPETIEHARHAQHQTRQLPSNPPPLFFPLPESFVSERLHWIEPRGA